MRSWGAPIRETSLSGTGIAFNGRAVVGSRVQAARFGGKVVAPGQIEGAIEVDEKETPFSALKR